MACKSLNGIPYLIVVWLHKPHSTLFITISDILTGYIRTAPCTNIKLSIASNLVLCTYNAYCSVTLWLGSAASLTVRVFRLPEATLLVYDSVYFSSAFVVTLPCVTC